MVVLGISGSPREGGNTQVLVQEALKAIQEEVETEFISLAERDVPPYRPQEDPPEAVQDLLDEMERADAHILGTPSYFGAPSAQLKALMDWTWRLGEDDLFEDKVAAALAVEVESGGELAAQALSHYFTQHAMVFAGYVVATGDEKREVLYDIKSVREARELALRVLDFVKAR